MFTGIIETIGTVREFVRHPSSAQVKIGAPAIAGSARLGESLAVDGACLTVSSLDGDAVVCDLSAETLERTTLGGLRVGARVNLERPLRLGDPAGGHLVAGHVDAVGRLVCRIPRGDWAAYRIQFPGHLAPFLVPKGVGGRGRDLIGQKADLLAAVRLPETAFQGIANTEVVTDILFLRKRVEGQQAVGETWSESIEKTVNDKYGNDQACNRNVYYDSHPENLLGKETLGGTMYRAGVGVAVDDLEAYVWLNVAAAQGVPGAAAVRDMVLARLSPAELQAAQAEARRRSAIEVPEPGPGPGPGQPASGQPQR